MAVILVRDMILWTKPVFMKVSPFQRMSTCLLSITLAAQKKNVSNTIGPAGGCNLPAGPTCLRGKTVEDRRELEVRLRNAAAGRGCRAAARAAVVVTSYRPEGQLRDAVAVGPGN